MGEARSPFTPEWHAIGREGQLSAEQIASGITALGKANHAEKGRYLQAFFSLSTGLERLGKLILMADHAISTNGGWLTDAELRQKGHNIRSLMRACELIANVYLADSPLRDRPNSAINEAIIDILSEFATQSRYYNLDFLVGGKSTRLQEPIAAWWSGVATPILEKHYSKKQREKDAREAALMDALMGPHSMVLHHDEDGRSITNLTDLMLRGATTRVVQKYGRMYTMQIVRWLAELIDELSHIGGYDKRIDGLFGLGELFAIFRMDDAYNRSRSTWSIYRP